MSNYNYKAVLSKVLRKVNSDFEKGGINLHKMSLYINNLLSEASNLTLKQQKYLKDSIYSVVKQIATEANFKGQLVLPYKSFEKMYRVCRRVWLDTKNKERVSDARALIKGGEYIFYMCSIHYPVAEDHKDAQGRLYVNKSWRSLVSGRDYRAVSEYIKTNKIMTIQDVMDNPPYLITRPNCRHKLVGVPTAAVLGGSDLKAYRKESHSKKRYERKKDYYKYRDEVYKKCSSMTSRATVEGNKKS